MEAQPPEAPERRPSSPNIDTSPLCDGRFVPYRHLGEGSQAVTLEAVDRAKGCVVAIKRFDVRGATSWKDVELAEREAAVLSTLSHRSLPAYVHHFEENGALFLVMEKIDGDDLAKRLARGERFSQSELVALLETFADVFAYLHRFSPPVLHRDIKPSNIIQRHDGSFVLIDFGSVRDGLRPLGGSTVVGTFGYMAPEQFQGRALPATDLYGAGATLITLITGQTPDKLPHRGLEIDVESALRGSGSPAWVSLLRRLLCADPELRPNDLKPLISELQAELLVDPLTAEQSHSANAASTPSERKNASDENRAVSDFEPIAAYPGSELPYIPRPFVFLLALLQVLAFLLLQVIAPLILTVMSVVFGRGLRKAAFDVRATGQVVNEELERWLSRISTAARPSRRRWGHGDFVRSAEDFPGSHRDYFHYHANRAAEHRNDKPPHPMRVANSDAGQSREPPPAVDAEVSPSESRRKRGL